MDTNLDFKYTIYKTTNKLNNKVYIGMHKTKNPYDDYMGSGKLFKRAMEKYEELNFVKEVLFIFDTAEEMFAKEKEIVNQLFIESDNTIKSFYFYRICLIIYLNSFQNNHVAFNEAGLV